MSELFIFTVIYNGKSVSVLYIRFRVVLVLVIVFVGMWF